MEEEKRDFFQNASHELKSPLTSIIGYQQIICDDIVDSKDQIINYSSKILKEAKRMNNIIIDMLNLSSIEQNYQKKQDIVKVDKAFFSYEINKMNKELHRWKIFHKFATLFK